MVEVDIAVTSAIIGAVVSSVVVVVVLSVVVVVLSVVEVELSEAVNSSFSSLLEHDENSNVMLTKRINQEVRLFILFLSIKC